MTTSRFFARGSPADGLPLLSAMRERSSRKRPRAAVDGGDAAGAGPRQPLTEMEKQVVALRRANPDALLLFECGYRFRIFAEDAENAAAVLGIRATQYRNFVEASVPVHRALVHSRRLVQAGFKVGIVRQVDSVAARAAAPIAGDQRKPLERCVAEMYTRATIPADEDAEDGGVGAARFIMCIVEATVHHKPLFVQLVHTMSDASRQHHSSFEAVNVGILAHDVHTGETSFAQFEDDAQRQKLKRTLNRVEPVEFVLPSGKLSTYTERIIEDYVRESGLRLSTNRRRHSEGNTESLMDSIRVERVSNAFLDATAETCRTALQSFPISPQLPPLCLHCFCGMHQFLLTLSMEKTLVSPRYNDIRDSVNSSISQFALPLETQRDLDVFTNSTTNSYHGSLYSILNRTVTGFGARRLREWIKSPLMSISELRERQMAVKFLSSSRGIQFSMDVEEELVSTILPRAKPLLRSIQRIHVGNATPSETINALNILIDVERKIEGLSRCVGAAASLSPELASQSKRILQLLKSYPLIANRALQCLSHLEADATAKNNTDAEHIILRWLYRDEGNQKRHTELTAKLADLQASYAYELAACRAALSDSSLEFKTLRGGSISDIHHLIEVSREKLATVPSDWLPVNSTKKLVRFHSREILQLHLLEDFTRQQKDQLVQKAWSSFISHVDGELYVSAMGCVDVLSTFDVLCSLAAVGRQSLNYSMPTFVEEHDGSRVLEIQDGRHPIIEALLEKASYISNSISLTSSGNRGGVLAVSGPNMGGKTSLLRMCALIVLMAQVGSFVPATHARLSLFDGIFTIIQRQLWANGGNSSTSSSLRIRELSSLSAITQSATPNSLVVVDEIGFALSSHHAKALAIAHALYFVNSVGCLLLFASHVASALETLSQKLGGRCVLKQFVYSARSVGQNENDDEMSQHVAFHYVIRDGIARDSLALDTARRAGLPQQIIDRATAMSEQQFRRAEHR